MFDFPNSPTTGQLVQGPTGAAYRWDGVKWTENVGVASGVPGVSSFNGRSGVVTLASTDVSGASGLLTTGGTMSGALGVVNAATQFSSEMYTNWTVCYPVANSPHPPNGNPVESQLVVQGQTAQDYTVPEWTAVFGNYINTGQPNGQKVSVYIGAIQGPLGGTTWALNTDVIRNAVPGPSSNVPGGPSGIGSGTPGTPGAIPVANGTIGYELDFSNFDQDCPPGGAFTVGMYLQNFSSYASLSAIYMGSQQWPSGNGNFAWHYGMMFAGPLLIKDATISDNTNSPNFLYMNGGTHTNVINVTGSAVVTNVISLTSGPSITNVINVAGATISGNGWAGGPLTVGAAGRFSGAPTGAVWASQGAIIGWNYSTNLGETDLINSYGGGVGGFRFYNVASSAAATPTLLAALNPSGNFTATGNLSATSAQLIQSGGGTTSAVLVTANGNAAYGWYDTSGATDTKKYDVLAAGGRFLFRFLNDAEGSTLNWLTVNRTGIAAPGIVFNGAVSATSLDSTVIGATAPAAGSFSQVNVGSAAGPNIRSGAGAATGTQPAGSLFLRTDGATGTRLYVSAGGGTWNAVAGV